MVAVMSWAQAGARRLSRHGLLEPLPSVPAAATAMAGAHAQIMSAAEISLGLRVEGVTRADIATALWDERTLVKTFGPRGTVHLLAGADLARWTAALAAVPGGGRMPDGVRLEAAQTDEVVDALATALQDGPLTVEELDERVPADCGAWAGERTMPAFGGFWPRWRQAITVAANRGALCFGPNRGRRVTYAAPGTWLPGFRPAGERESVAWLLRRYLHAYGPATPAHFAQWLSAPVPWARAAFEAQPLDEVLLDGLPAWVNAGDTEPGTVDRSVRLLPYFDAFVVGSHPRDSLFAGRAADRALAGRQAGNFPVLLVDGVVAGVWHQRRSGTRISVTVEPLIRMTARLRRAVEVEAERVAMIQQANAEIVLGPITVGPHA